MCPWHVACPTWNGDLWECWCFIASHSPHAFVNKSSHKSGWRDNLECCCLDFFHSNLLDLSAIYTAGDLALHSALLTTVWKYVLCSRCYNGMTLSLDPYIKCKSWVLERLIIWLLALWTVFLEQSLNKGSEVGVPECPLSWYSLLLAYFLVTNFLGLVNA